MNFYYRPIITAPPSGDDYQLILRPEIAVTLIGPTDSVIIAGLVDTGSDNTILPKSAADLLKISLSPATGPSANVFGGKQIELYSGDVKLQLESEDQTICWSTPVYFFDFPNQQDETAIMGHVGFLDYFTAVFDGEMGMLTLTPNHELPTD